MPADPSDATFRTTRWSIVARASEPATARRALGELCELYWYPLYAYLRRRGEDEAEALDVVQSFCAQLLERGGIAGAHAAAGSFRGYLLGALRHFLDNRSRAARALRRGGGITTWSMDDAEARYGREPVDNASPERVFERRWAQAVIDRATERLRREYAERGRELLLRELEPVMLGADSGSTHREVAARLDSTEGAVKVALHRLRLRMRELIRDEIAETVTSDGVDAELRALFDAVAR